MSVTVRTPDGNLDEHVDAVRYEIDDREMLHVFGDQVNSYGTSRLAIYNAGAWSFVAITTDERARQKLVTDALGDDFTTYRTT